MPPGGSDVASTWAPSLMTARASSSGGQDSHKLRAMADANALALLPDGDGVQAGRRVEVMLLDNE
jgi:molybdopterin biosynthesis enzyme